MCEHVFEIDESRADAMGSMPCERCEEIVRCPNCGARVVEEASDDADR